MKKLDKLQNAEEQESETNILSQLSSNSFDVCLTSWTMNLTG